MVVCVLGSSVAFMAGGCLRSEQAKATWRTCRYAKYYL